MNAGMDGNGKESVGKFKTMQDIKNQSNQQNSHLHKSSFQSTQASHVST